MLSEQLSREAGSRTITMPKAQAESVSPLSFEEIREILTTVDCPLGDYCGFAQRDDLLSPRWDQYVQVLASIPLGGLCIEGWQTHWSRRWEFPWAYRAIAHFVRPVPGRRRILESGCGLTPLPFWLAGAGHFVTGIDLDSGCAEKWSATGVPCRPDAGTTRFQVSDMEKLPEPDGSFDISYSVSAIEHTNDPLAAVSEMIRVTAIGGIVVLTCDVDILNSDSVTVTELKGIQKLLFECTQPAYPLQFTCPQEMLTFEQRTIAPLPSRRRALKALLQAYGLKSRADSAIFAYAGVVTVHAATS